MDTDDGQRDSIEWLRSDFDAQPVGNLDFLITSENGIFEGPPNISPNQKRDNHRDIEKNPTSVQKSGKQPSASSILSQKRQCSNDRLQQKPHKKQYSGKIQQLGLSQAIKKAVLPPLRLQTKRSVDCKHTMRLRNVDSSV